MVASLAYPRASSRALEGAETVLVLVPERQVKAGWLARALDAPWRALVEKAAGEKPAGPKGRVVSMVNPGESPARIVLGLLPDTLSRHNAPARPHAALTAARAADPGSQDTVVLACAEEKAHAVVLACTVARAAPLYSRKSNGASKKAKGKRAGKPRLAFVALDPAGKPVALSKGDRLLVDRARWAAMLVDTPAAELSPADFEKAVRKAARGIEHLRVTSIRGAELLERGLGGLHAVGRAARVAPRLVLLEYRPPKARRKVGLVGKGIVYDTGGLSLKPSTSMGGMKGDMGGAAAVAGAALALAEAGGRDAFLAALPLAENAIGPDAYRPDDILTMHSGKTVEINNTDAEGRLLLADGVSYVARRYAPAVIIDAATLTGAQLVSTGTRHAAVVSNREGLERRAVEVGRSTGDLTHPLPFAPEFFQEEFRSKIADMKNSVANRMNAQSSCAAQFVYAHIQDQDVPWLHIDFSGPARREERGTGFGVLLLAGLIRSITAQDLKA